MTNISIWTDSLADVSYESAKAKVERYREVNMPASTAKKNMETWEQLRCPDPKWTKKFKKAGGFAGTSIDPVYNFERMTMIYGPATKGWGMTEPVFTTLGECVYCTIGVWTKDKDNVVYGTGGDKVYLDRKNYDFDPKQPVSESNQKQKKVPNDEAFKAAQTDALGNAFKALGMNADVYMGLFDNSKYVREATENSDKEQKKASPAKSKTAKAANAEEPVAEEKPVKKTTAKKAAKEEAPPCDDSTPPFETPEEVAPQFANAPKGYADWQEAAVQMQAKALDVEPDAGKQALLEFWSKKTPSAIKHYTNGADKNAEANAWWQTLRDTILEPKQEEVPA